MATIYTMYDNYTGQDFAYPTLAEARRHRTENYERGARPAIMKYEIADMPLRQLLCAVYNQTDFAKASREALPEA